MGSNLLLFVLVFVIHTQLSESLNGAGGCPDLTGCRCRCRLDQNKTLISANCTNRNGSLANILDCLPSTILNLTFRTESLIEDMANFSRFPQMKKLELLWSRPQDELPRNRDLHNFSDAGLFEGLRDLKELRINFPTTGIHPSLLRPLEKLEILDFSNMGYVTTAQLANVFNESRLREKAIRIVLLRRLSGVNPIKLKQFDLQELFPVFKGMLVRELDISDNGEVYVYPGTIEYMPVIETFRFAGTSLRFDEKQPQQIYCFMIEGFFHKSVKVIDVSNISTIGFGVFSVLQDFLKSYIKKWMNCYITPGMIREECLCETYKEMCGLSLKTTFTCDNFPKNWNPFKLIDLKCENHILIPQPEKLETVLAVNTQTSFISSVWKKTNRCFADNRMKHQDFSYVRLDPSSAGIFTMYGYERMEELVLEYSDWGIYFVNAKFLHNLPNLKLLNLGGTTVGLYISNDTNNEIFNMSSNLVSLILHDAGVTSIPKYEFSPLHNLTHLDLSGNSLSNVSFDISNLISLEHLNLSRNNLNNLTEQVIACLEANTKTHEVNVDLSENMLSCNCDSFRFLQWVKKTKVHFVRKGQYLCVHPDGLRSLDNVENNLDSLHKRCFPPPDYTIYISIGSTLLSCLVLAFVVSMVYTTRWKIRYACLWLKYRNDLDDAKRYKYDAFVVYSDEDRYWVHQIMLNNLEKLMKLKLCVHYRDFVPGHNIEEQIVTNINASRKTIIVITPHFLESNWCDLEMQVARNRLYSEGKDVIVPIILIDCPKENLTAAVRNIIARTTYITWTNETAQQEFFWKKLALSICTKVVGREDNTTPNEETPLIPRVDA